jgi:hypothetical protein
MSTDKLAVIGLFLFMIMSISGMIFIEYKQANIIEKAVMSGHDPIAAKCAFKNKMDDVCVEYMKGKK